MKYTIEGFNQREAVALGLGCEELVILRWFVDFYVTDKMAKIDIDGTEYMWVDYTTLLQELPIIRCNKRNLTTRMRRLVDANVLTYRLHYDRGTYSTYGIGANFARLISDSDSAQSTPLRSNNQPLRQNQSHPCPKSDTTPVQNQAPYLSNSGHTPCPTPDDQKINLQKISLQKINLQNIYNTSPTATATEAHDTQQQKKFEYQSVVDAYNSICKSLPSVKVLTDKRRRAIKARLEGGYTLERLTDVFRAVEDSDFLTGKAGAGRWMASFDWIILEGNLAKIEEGNYANRSGTEQAKPTTQGKVVNPKYTIPTKADYAEGWD